MDFVRTKGIVRKNFFKKVLVYRDSANDLCDIQHTIVPCMCLQDKFTNTIHKGFQHITSVKTLSRPFFS